MSLGLVASAACTVTVKLAEEYSEESPRTFSVRFLAITFEATPPAVYRRDTSTVQEAWPKGQSQEVVRKKSVDSLGNIPCIT